MSTSITLRRKRDVPIDGLVRTIALRDLEATFAVATKDGMVPEGIHHFHLRGTSTRTTEVTVEAKTIDVRIFTLASREDVELAVRIAEAMASFTGALEADAELAGVVPVSELRVLHDAAWADEQARSGIRAIRAILAQSGGPVEMPGPNRSFCIGERLLGELAAAGPDEEMHVRVLDKVRFVRWFPGPTASIFVTNDKGKEVKLAIWAGEPIVFPNVVYAGIHSEGETFLIPAERVPELAGNERWQLLDERQGHLAAIADWPALVKRARAFRIAPDDLR